MSETIQNIPYGGNKLVEAYEKLKKAIIDYEFPPGKLLIERELCELIGVSRTPVREALRRLSSDGFVDFVPGRGTVVTRLTKEDMIHIYELKEALDKMAVKLCIQRKRTSSWSNWENVSMSTVRQLKIVITTSSRIKTMSFTFKL
jgi:DNA-binding GntR family transcriptional regulator